MEKMRPSPSAPGAQATQSTTSAKNRSGHSQGNAGAGDFLGLLSALGQTMLPGGVEADLLSSSTGTETADTGTQPQNALFSTGNGAVPTDMMSLFALQAGFAGGQAAPSSGATASLPVGTAMQAPVGTLAIGANGVALTSGSGTSPLGLVANPMVPLPVSGTTGASVSPLPLGIATSTAVDTLAIGSRGVTVASSGGELGLVAQTAALDGTAEVQADQGRGVAGAAGTKATPASRLGGITTAAVNLRSSTDLRQDPLERQVSSAALVSAVQAAATGVDTPRDPLAGGVGGGQHSSASGMAPLSSSTPPPIVLSGQEGLLGSQGQGAARGGEGRGTSGQGADNRGLLDAVGSVAEPANLGDNPMFDLAAALPAEDAVAEQVSYWVNQNIQNAELTVEHNGHPVEVTVSLSGTEAHVSFRSDQNETRALLDASMGQLRDLLESQGLTLSGMTVGDSASQGNQDNPGGQRDNPRGARQTTTVQASAPMEGVRRSSGAVSDKAVDIFV